MLNVAEALRLATQKLASGRLARPRLEAELLLCLVLQVDRAFLFAHPEIELSLLQQDRLRDLLQQRARQYPLPYLRRSQEFYGRTFHVDPAVLIPRPETELLVDVALSWLKRQPPARIFDLGTGSGCIAATLACELASCRVIASDISYPALRVAQRNIRRHDCRDRVQLLCCDLFQGLLPRKTFDLLVCNPPYVGSQERDEVDPQTYRFEPAIALFAAEKGLRVYRRLLQRASLLLKPGGRLILELGHRSRKAVVQLANDSGWRWLGTEKDLAGIDRCAVLRPSRI